MALVNIPFRGKLMSVRVLRSGRRLVRLNGRVIQESEILAEEMQNGGNELLIELPG